MKRHPPRVYASLSAFLHGEHLTQDAFARRVGIVPSYISMMLSGERTPSLTLALRIARKAHIPIESLLRDQERVAS